MVVNGNAEGGGFGGDVVEVKRIWHVPQDANKISIQLL